MSTSDTYALSTGKIGSERLDIQSEYMHTESCDHLARAGLKKEQIVCDIACGNGYMTHYMAEVVGPKGHVYALDASSAQLEFAKRRIQEAGFKNVTFIQANILDDLKWTIPQADLVYSRLLLMHVTEPNKAIANMLSLLKTNGALALQEPITSSCYVSGDPNQLQSFKKTIVALGTHLGLDYDIGFRLKTLVEEQGLKDVEQKERQFELEPDFARKLLKLTLKDWGERAFNEKIISEDDYFVFEDDIALLDKPFWISKAIYITGKKQ